MAPGNDLIELLHALVGPAAALAHLLKGRETQVNGRGARGGEAEELRGATGGVEGRLVAGPHEVTAFG